MSDFWQWVTVVGVVGGFVLFAWMIGLTVWHVVVLVCLFSLLRGMYRVGRHIRRALD